MNPGRLPRTIKLEANPKSSGESTKPEGTAVYGHATYNYKKGVFIYRVEGVIRDLSETGCSIRGTISQLVGSRIRVILSLNDQQPPLRVNGAIVTWLTGECFGVKFPQLRPQDLIRLQEYVTVTCNQTDHHPVRR